MLFSETPDISNFHIETVTTDYILVTWTYNSKNEGIPVGLLFTYSEIDEGDTTDYPENGYISAVDKFVKIKGIFDVEATYEVRIKLFEGNNTFSTDMEGLGSIIYMPGK